MMRGPGPAPYTAATLGDHLEAARKLPMFQRAQEAESLMRGVQTILARQEHINANLQRQIVSHYNKLLEVEYQNPAVIEEIDALRREVIKLQTALDELKELNHGPQTRVTTPDPC